MGPAKHAADGIPRIGPEEAHRKVVAGEALLVCAYSDAVKCNRKRPEGSITLSDLQVRLPSLPKTREIIFFCS
jgi:hypothetical protein